MWCGGRGRKGSGWARRPRRGPAAFFTSRSLTHQTAPRRGGQAADPGSHAAARAGGGHLLGIGTGGFLFSFVCERRQCSESPQLTQTKKQKQQKRKESGREAETPGGALFSCAAVWPVGVSGAHTTRRGAPDARVPSCPAQSLSAGRLPASEERSRRATQTPAGCRCRRTPTTGRPCRRACPTSRACWPKSTRRRPTRAR